MKKRVFALFLSLFLCVSLLPAALAAEEDAVRTFPQPTPAEGEASRTYDEAVKKFQSDTYYETEQSFDSDYGTVFIYSHGPNPHGQHGFLALVTKAPCAKGEGQIIGLPHVRHSLFCFGKPPHTAQLSEDGKTFTYSFHYDQPVISGDWSKLLRPAGDYTFTVDLPTGEVTERYVPLGYEKTLATFTQAEGYVIDRLLESPTATAVLRHQEFPAANDDPAYSDYELYLVFRDDNAPEAFRRLLLPSTVYLNKRSYAPTDRAPDSIYVSSGNTLNYEYSFRSPLTRPNGESLHEAGIYTYIVDAATGELTVSHTGKQGTSLLLNTEEEKLAGKLKELGLFLGNGQGSFELNRAPTRTEALVMLIRALGEDGQARAAGRTHPFTDVPEWAHGYVSWGYEKGYTKGISDTQFGSENTAGCEMYLTFLLRALGYTEGTEGDFVYYNPYYLAYQVGIFPTCVDFLDFRRSDVAEATVAALFAKLKGSDTPLWNALTAKGAFSESQFTAQFPADPYGNEKSLKGPVNDACESYFAGREKNHVTAQANLILGQSTNEGETTVDALVCVVEADLNPGGGATGTHQYYGLELRFSAGGELLERRELPKDDPVWVGAEGRPLLEGSLDGAAWEGSLDGAAWEAISAAAYLPLSYDEEVARLRGGFTYRKDSERTFETDECTVFLYDRGGAMNTGSGYIAVLYKPGSAKGDGFLLTPPHPGNDRSRLIPRTPDHVELSADKKTFTYSYHFDEPFLAGGRIVRPAGDFTYVIDLTSGEVTETVPEIPAEVNTYAASLERFLASCAEGGYTVEQTLETPLCTLIFCSSPVKENGDRGYLLYAVYKTDVDADVSGSVWHTNEGEVKYFGLPTTRVDLVSRPGAPMIYTHHMPDSMSLSEDGNTFTLTYSDPYGSNPGATVIDLRSGLSE